MIARKIGLPTVSRQILAPAAAIVLLFALIVASRLIFRTKSGTIVFENLPERSVVTVNGDNFEVDWPDGKGKGHAQITIPAGKHVVEVAVNGVRVKGDEVIVEAGGVTPFVVRFDQPQRLPEPPNSRSAPAVPAPQRANNSVGMTLVLIPAGNFVMGCDDGGELEKPAHPVRISSPFYLGAHEVTQAQFETIMGKNPSFFAKQPKNPVDSVTWLEAITFCNRLSGREMLAPYYRINGADDVTILGGKGYRLPTEAEWEYAARAGNKSNIPFLSNGPLFDVAWVGLNSERKTHPVGEKKPNPFVLYDMYGNVWEWCWDWAGHYPEGLSVDPAGPESGIFRVLRGNAWYNGEPICCRPALRHHLPSSSTAPNHDEGFRVAAGGRDGLPVISADRSAVKPKGKPPASSGANAQSLPE
jgi:formylglycine-generating enzyme required for sulfatase activity